MSGGQCALEEGEIFADFNRNEDKHAKRQLRSGEAFGYEEGTSEAVHEEMVTDTLLDDVLMEFDIKLWNSTFQKRGKIKEYKFEKRGKIYQNKLQKRGKTMYYVFGGASSCLEKTQSQ